MITTIPDEALAALGRIRVTFYVRDIPVIQQYCRIANIHPWDIYYFESSWCDDSYRQFEDFLWNTTWKIDREHIDVLNELLKKNEVK